MEPKPLHPHRALWIIGAAVLVGALSYGAYLWQGVIKTPVPDIATDGQKKLTPEQSQSILDSLKSTTTPDTADKSPTPDNKTLNSLKAKGSATSSGSVNNSVLDSLKSH